MTNTISIETVASKIIIIRGQKVMLDRDLAQLYGVATKSLNQAVQRNRERFPADFMFTLSLLEKNELVTNCDRFRTLRHSTVFPFAFTEQGVAMLSSILRSKEAIAVNIQIMRTFTQLRKMLMNYQDLKEKIESIERKYDHQFKNVFDAIKLLISNDQEIQKKLTYEEEKKRDTHFGFRPNRK